ncbi:MAG: TIGR02147 family protein [Fibrobacteria bacterium]
MNPLYEYSDYRLFIKHYYEERKAENPAFSFRYLSQKAGINSAPFFKFLIEGKRNLTQETLIKVAAALKLDEQGREYFEHLVFFNQAKTVKDKNLFFSKLIALQKARNTLHIGSEKYEYFSEWYHCAIRELVTLVDFREDYAKLGNSLRPALSAVKAQDSVDLLLRLGFLKQVGGKFVQAEPLLTTGYGIEDYQIIKFQIKMMRMAIEAFDRSNAAERSMSSLTFSLSRETYNTIVKEMRAFRAKIMELVGKDESPEMVYHLNIGLFPMSKPPQKAGRS